MKNKNEKFLNIWDKQNLIVHLIPESFPTADEQLVPQYLGAQPEKFEIKI